MDELVEVTDEEKALAAVCHASVVLGFAAIAPFVIYLWKQDSSPFVKYHAGQAMVFHLGATAVIIVTGILTCGATTLLLLPWMLYELWLAWEAFQGKAIGYPGMEHMFRD